MINRRDFVKHLLHSSAVIGFLPRIAFATPNGGPKQPRNFLQIIYASGLSHHYLFDARPKAFTAAGYVLNQTYNIQNAANPYFHHDAINLQGKHGDQTWAHPLMHGLVDDYFRTGKLSVLNGVYMSTNADHLGNVEKFLTGYLLPEVRAPLSQRWNQGVTFSTSASAFTSGASLLPLLGLSDFIRLLAGKKDEQYSLLQRWLRAPHPTKVGPGDYALREAYVQADAISASLKGENLDALRSFKPGEEFEAAILAASTVFSLGLTNNLVIYLDPKLDNHTASLNETNSYLKICDHMHKMLQKLEQTPSMYGNSLFDNTLVMFGTEFNRTMYSRDSGYVFGDGTDHNPSGNSVILAGAGIVGGQIFGQTDKRSLAGDTAALPTPGVNGYGERNDRIKLVPQKGRIDGVDVEISAVAMPFDFDQCRSVDKEGHHKASDLLSYESVANTIIDIFAGDQNQKFKLDGQVARSIHKLVLKTN